MLTAEPPKQPLSFSHKKHAGELALLCKTCHVNPEPNEAMTFPAEKTCLACHQTIKAASPELQKLAQFFAEKKQIPWTRVYQLPSFVYWSHKPHLTTGVTCGDCHGPVAEREVLSKEKGIAMSDCMECHRQKKVSNDCSYCHEKLN